MDSRTYVSKLLHQKRAETEASLPGSKRLDYCVGSAFWCRGFFWKRVRITLPTMSMSRTFCLSLFCFCLLTGALVTLGQDPDTRIFVIGEKEYRFKLAPAIYKGTTWDGKGNPPLSIEKATDIARRAQPKIYDRGEPLAIEDITLTRPIPILPKLVLSSDISLSGIHEHQWLLVCSTSIYHDGRGCDKTFRARVPKGQMTHDAASPL
jgi:hypothetical protein